MRSFLRRIATAAILAPAALGAATMIASPAEAARTKVSEEVLQAEANRLTNIERTKHGCPAVTVNAQLTRAARGHSGWMAQTGTFSHTGRDGSTFATRAAAAGYTGASSENIAWGQRDAAQLVGAWMNSPGHRANIVNCRATTVGVGAVYSADGTTYFTQIFGA